MKKFILFLFIYIAFSFNIASQNLILTDTSGVNITSDTLILSAELSVEDLFAYVHVTNNSASAIDTKVKKIVNYQSIGTEIRFCWDVCYPDGINESNQYDIIGQSKNKPDSTGRASVDVSGFLKNFIGLSKKKI